MSSDAGPRSAGNRARSALMISVVSSTAKVVWVRYDTRAGSGIVSSATSSALCTRTVSVRGLAQGALDLLVPGVADQDHGVTTGGEPAGLGVHLGDQRARRVDHLQPPVGGLGPHRGGHPVSGEHHRGPVRNGVQLVDEHRATRLEIGYHMGVVHDLLADIDRAAPLVQQLLHDRDRALDPSAERPRRGEQDSPWSSRVVRGDRHR